MAFDSPEDGSLSTAESKLAKKWRGKFLKKDAKDRKASRDEQVNDFLSSSRPSAASSQPPSYLQPRSSVTAPRIDVTVSQRWPESHDISSQAPTLPVLDLRHPVDPPKKTRRKGLRVTFSNKPPDVMGEGGDEAEAPTQDLLLYRVRSNSSTSGRTDGDSSDSNTGGNIIGRGQFVPSLSVDHAGDAGNGVREPTLESPGVTNSQNSDFLLSIASQPKGSRISWRAPSGDGNSLAQSIQARMRAEEGKALQKAITDEEPSGQTLNLDTRQETILPPDDQRGSPTSLGSPQKERPTGLNFWSNVIASMPDANNEPNQENEPSRNRPSPPSNNNSMDTYSALPPPSNNNSLDSHSTLPPPYQRAPSKQSSYNENTAPRDTAHADKHERNSSSSSKGGLKSIANLVGENALGDFTSYVDNHTELFSIAAETAKPLMDTSLSEWIRASVWWFLRGRAELEAFIRSRPSSAGGSMSQQSQQAVLDLAKAWWINQHIVPRHPSLEQFGNVSTDAMQGMAQSTGNHQIASLMALHQSIVSHLRGLAMSMKRNNIIPAVQDRMIPSQEIDTTIWVRYPIFAPGVASVLSGSNSKTMLMEDAVKNVNIGDTMPMGDNSRFFCYGRMFVDAHISSGDNQSEEYAIPCMLSIIRDRTDWNVVVTITSQNELVNISIRSDQKYGPTWQDVQWQVRTHGLMIRLPHGFELDVHFKEPDFKMLWKIVEYTRKVESDLLPKAGETLIFEDVLKVFHYMESGPGKSFPAEPTQRCRLRLFEKTVKVTEGTGTREFHRGYRMIAVTSPKVKILSSVCHILGEATPIVFGYLRGDDGSPAMMLKVTDKGNTHSMLLTFHDQESRSKMHSLLLGLVPSDVECKTPDVSLKSFTLEQPPSQFGTAGTTHLQFVTPTASVINKDPSFDGAYSTVLSEHLRVFVSSSWGSIMDRINLGPGDLKINLDVNSLTAISVLRPPQNDMTVAVAENLTQKEMPSQLAEFLNVARSCPIIRRYDFGSISDMHYFQQAITGFRVLFDGAVSMFAISRRRMVVPIYKKWEASKARIQIIQQEKVVQLVAFFGDFSHGRCMNFVLKSTDNFEGFNRSGRYGVKIVDAKFALPKNDQAEAPDFVCLDMPDYPGEHDDISIAFDSEKDRFNFQNAIPGPVREPSRMGSLRK